MVKKEVFSALIPALAVMFLQYSLLMVVFTAFSMQQAVTGQHWFYITCGILVSGCVTAIVTIFRDWDRESAAGRRAKMLSSAMNEHLTAHGLPEINIDSHLCHLEKGEDMLVLERVRAGLWDLEGLREKRLPKEGLVCT